MSDLEAWICNMPNNSAGSAPAAECSADALHVRCVRWSASLARWALLGAAWPLAATQQQQAMLQASSSQLTHVGLELLSRLSSTQGRSHGIRMLARWVTCSAGGSWLLVSGKQQTSNQLGAARVCISCSRTHDSSPAARAVCSGKAAGKL